MRPQLLACRIALATGAVLAATATPASATTAIVTAAVQPAATPASTWRDTTPAPARPCPAHALCLRDGVGFTGHRWDFPLGSTYHYNHWYYVGTGTDNKASSLFNNRGFCTLVSKNRPRNGHVTGPTAIIPPGVRLADLRQHRWPDNTSGNNSISGFNLLNHC